MNNAGVLESGSVENTSLAQFDRVMNINLRAIFHLTHLLVPTLIEHKGAIINVSSVNGIRSVRVCLCVCEDSVPGYSRVQHLESRSGSTHAVCRVGTRGERRARERSQVRSPLIDQPGVSVPESS